MAGNIQNVSQIDFSQSILRSRQLIYGLVDMNPPNLFGFQPIPRMFNIRSSNECEFYGNENGRPHQKWVKTRSELEQLCSRLSLLDEFSIHVRQHKGKTIIPFITTIQIGTWTDGDYLITALELHGDMKTFLGPVLENKNILKIFYKVQNQVLALQRDYEIYSTGCADLAEFGAALTGDKFPETFKEVCRKFAPMHFPYIVSPPRDVLVRTGRHCNSRWFNFLTHQTHLVLRIFNKIKDQMQYDQMVVGFNWSKLAASAVFETPEFTVQKAMTEQMADVLIHLVEHAKVTNNATLFRRVEKTFRTQNPDRRFFALLMELVTWRQEAAMNYNIIPEEIFSDENIFELCINQNQPKDWIKSNIHNLGPRHTQYRIVQKIMKAEVAGTVMGRLHRILCRNCYFKGHPAQFCVYPPSVRSGSLRFYLNRPENVYEKIQYLRKHAKYIEKAAEEVRSACVKIS